jgi:DNA-binding CsgD family transcriptional regulator
LSCLFLTGIGLLGFAKLLKRRGMLTTVRGAGDSPDHIVAAAMLRPPAGSFGRRPIHETLELLFPSPPQLVVGGPMATPATFAYSRSLPLQTSNNFACRTLGRRLLPQPAWEELRVLLQLSPREMQIAQGVFDDQQEQCIAFELGISRHTVNTYLQRMYRKVGVSNRTQLVLHVLAAHMNLMDGGRGVAASTS